MRRRRIALIAGIAVAVLAVAVTVALTVGVGRGQHAVARQSPVPPTTSAASASTPTPTPTATTPASTSAAASASIRPAPPQPAPVAQPAHTAQTAQAAHTATAVATPPVTPPAAPRPGQVLPLNLPTGSATQVVTVTAPSTASTTATVSWWSAAPGGGWLRVGGPVAAHVGADGLSSHPSESMSGTPIGSFTLSQAFGNNPDPGTALPYIRADSGSWWISQDVPGLYNTYQHCYANCPFRQADPNEHISAIWQYGYAVVIDYNRYPAVYPNGSAFFLHITDGSPTAGCVAISEPALVSVLRWLSPSAHPRILIGVG